MLTVVVVLVMMGLMAIVAVIVVVVVVLRVGNKVVTAAGYVACKLNSKYFL